MTRHHIFGLSFVVALTGAVTPGPMLALVITQVMAWGFWAVWPILIGHAAIELALIGLLAGGLSRFLARPAIRGGLALTGGLVLLLMAWQIFRDVPSMTLESDAGGRLSWLALIAGGAGVSLANPYFTGWWATVGSGQFAALNLKRAGDFWAFFWGHEMADAAWYAFIALVLVLGRTWLNDATYQSLIRICGLVVALLGLLFIGLGIRCWTDSARGYAKL